MFELIKNIHNRIFYEIVNSRRTIRSFKTIKPEKGLIDEIIKTGLISPFAAIPAAGMGYLL